MRIASSLLLGGLALAIARVPDAAPDPIVYQTVSGQVDFMKSAKAQPYRDGFVYLEPIRRGRHIPPLPQRTSIHQKNKTFTPNLLVVPVGSTVAFPNEDAPGTSHNVFSPTPPVFDLSRYGTGESRSQQFKIDGEYDIYCDVHPGMVAKIKVVDADLIAPVVAGRFTIRNVPPGSYKLVAWAPDSDEVKERITVVAGTDLVVSSSLHVQLGTPKTSHLNKKNLAYPPAIYHP